MNTTFLNEKFVGNIASPGGEPSKPVRMIVMQRLMKTFMSVLPLALISSLLYAALFIKPEISTSAVAPLVIVRGDLLYGIASPEPGVIWAAGSDGKVLRSEDAGKSWVAQRTPTTANLQDIAAWDSLHAVAVGNDGMVVTSSDGGKTWTQVQIPRSKVANKLLRVRIFDDGNAWAVGEMGAVLVSKDRGRTWARAAGEEDVAWNDVFVHGKDVWLVGEFGRISTSGDGGLTWKMVASPVKTSLMSIAFKDEKNGIAVGVDGVVLATGDAGVKWTGITKVTREHLFDVIWDGANWAAVGDKGMLLVAEPNGITWKATRVSTNDREWHTKIVSSGESYLVAGSKFGIVSKAR